MQVESKKRMPERLRKKMDRDQKDQAAQEKRNQECLKKCEELKATALKQGKKHWDQYRNEERELIKSRRQAKAEDRIFVEAENKLFLVIRIKGLRKIPPKEKKILRLFRLRQLHTAVLIRNNKATLHMLRRIEPYVTYGVASRSVLKSLVYKRGFLKINGQRIPLSSNQLVSKNLGKYGVDCMEDLLHELYNVGENFKKVNNAMWPFKLNSPKGGFKKKRQPYLNGGAAGPRENEINKLVKRML